MLGSRRAGESFVRWLRSSDEISAAGAGSLLLLIAARLELQDNMAARAGLSGADPGPSAWTSADLEAWLNAAPPERPVKPGRYLGRHPL